MLRYQKPFLEVLCFGLSYKGLDIIPCDGLHTHNTKYTYSWVSVNQLFLIYKTGKFIWFNLMSCRKEQSLTRWPYLRSSFLLIKAFIYSESFFCINANRSQALPLPTGVLRKHRNQTTKSSRNRGHSGTDSFTFANGPPAGHVHWSAPHNFSHHILTWGILYGLEEPWGYVWNKCSGQEVTT